MKKYIISALILLSVHVAFAQDFFDALKYSQTEYGGTARSIAMGSAFGALGGDFVSASINPAGLGLYRASEFSLSPTLNLNQVNSTYLENSEMNDKYNFNFNNLSWVTSANTGAETGILSFSFGIGYNRLKNFNSNSYIQGYGAQTTLLNYFTDYANDLGDANSFDYHYEGLAWNAWLIDQDANGYFNDLTSYDDFGNVTGIKPHQQKSTIDRGGHIDEYVASLGLNINHKVYVGASFGLVDLDYNQRTMFAEIDDDNQSEFLKDYTMDTYLTESGMGVNFKTGIIYRPTKSLRFGVAVHTPNFYNISKTEDKSITAHYDQKIGNDNTGYDTKWADENNIYYDYKLETPFKANFSGAYTIGDVALVSLDYELVNYAGAKFRNSGDNYDYSNQNSDITHTLKSTGNLRVGGEYRVTPNFSVRAGYNLFGNPWQSTFTGKDGTTSDILNKNDTYSSYSAGFGYRQNNFYVDFAYRLSSLSYAHKVHEIYYTNPSGGNAVANIDETNNQATITFGFRF